MTRRLSPAEAQAVITEASARIIEQGCLSPDQAQAQITEASARIIEHGFNAALFTTDAVYGAGLPISQFLKVAKKFTMFDRGFRDELLTEAIRSNIMETPSSATFADVVGDDGVVQEAAVKIFKPQMDDFATPQKRGSILELAGGVEVPPVVDSLTFPPNKRARGNSS
ncbi:hypothetical protein GOBAR_DD33797 [Gossypium barbadense]|nr:hypothetical protein GOBAR_DD33797 [Gossypium barbadense]